MLFCRELKGGVHLEMEHRPIGLPVYMERVFAISRNEYDAATVVDLHNLTALMDVLNLTGKMSRRDFFFALHVIGSAGRDDVTDNIPWDALEG